MKTLKFRNNDKIPMLGLGTWKSSPGDIYAAIRKAIEIGYRHIDCAAIYGNKKEIGMAFKDAMAAGDVKREDLFITSKLWNNAHKKADVSGAIEKTLSDLRLDYSKSVNPERLAGNFESDRIQLSRENMDALGDLDSGDRYVSGIFWTVPGSSYTLENLWD